MAEHDVFLHLLCGCSACVGNKPIGMPDVCRLDVLTQAYRAAINAAARVCSDMLDNSDYGLDRERTVGELRHRINKLGEHKGHEETGRVDDCGCLREGGVCNTCAGPYAEHLGQNLPDVAK